MSLATVPEPLTVAAPSQHGDEGLYEIINGHRVELPPMSIYAVVIANLLARKLGNHAEAHDLGQVLLEALFRLPLAKQRNRRPDIGFVSYQRWAKGRPIPKDDNAWEVVPELAVEVVSPTDFAEELLEKLEEYFQAGVQMVWVVYPRRGIVHVYESLTQIRGLTRTDELDGGKVLPGFRLALATLFEDQANPA
jgi:Uma2 family endonuclease